MNTRWKNRPVGSNWGDFGEDDQRGRLNLLTPQKVLQAVAEVKVGKVFCLSMPLDYPGGNYHQLNRWPPLIQPMVRNNRVIYNYRKDTTHTDVICDDSVLLRNQASTHWDSLAHIGSAFDADGDGVAEKVFYNGYRAGEHIIGPNDTDGIFQESKDGIAGAKALGIENMAAACVQGRGVMIDLHNAFSRERKFVGYDELMRICEADHVTVEEGDMVCLHTGLAHALMKMNKNPDIDTLENSFSVLDAADERLLRWIDESGLSVLIADNFAVEGVPARPGVKTVPLEPLHELCIFKLGIHIAELWHLSELNAWLRAHRRYRFFLTAPPLRLPGAVGSPVTPVATV